MHLTGWAVNSAITSERACPCPPCRPHCRWALGVLIYELCHGLPPFYHEDKIQMYQRIVNGKYSFPPTFSKVGTEGLALVQPLWVE